MKPAHVKHVRQVAAADTAVAAADAVVAAEATAAVAAATVVVAAEATAAVAAAVDVAMAADAAAVAVGNPQFNLNRKRPCYGRFFVVRTVRAKFW
jgi:hypothetical protein